MIRKSSLIKFIRKNKPKGCVVERINKRAIEHLAKFLNQELKEIVIEANKSKYGTMLPIDIDRGIKKWMQKQIDEIKKQYVIE